ncbi:hypothetical protein HBH98_003990 [Parastagonospora nodorum]|nr:hypothetical protein HBH50_184790 [Parastagonospora nodorum]KAH4078643.1 hypothetical protein HBH48_229100 [Parastagonospora nodorum]KAH4353323.1 hypothetical protein HBH98_003990 [Parastagonospora nodorum]KAH4397974.1 hypothetical protein HBH97_011040 [Parastagonospora nodorum]KAH4429743.1 hypothetical protein HBH99_004030 [Parastagonospora nodorum]
MPSTHRTTTQPSKSLVKQTTTHRYPGIIANCPSLSILENRLRILHKESTQLFRRAHNTFTDDAHTLKFLEESDAKAEEMMRLIAEVEAKIGELLEKEEGGSAKLRKKVEEERVWKEKWVIQAREEWVEEYGFAPDDGEIKKMHVAMQDAWVEKNAMVRADDA